MSNAGLSNLQCARFITARAKQGLDAAVDMAEKWLAWRRSPLHPNSPITPDNILRVTNADNICVGVGMHGHRALIPHSLQGEDREGRPVYWEKNGEIAANFSNVKAAFSVDDLITMHVRTQELTGLRMANLSMRYGRSISQCVVVFDVANIPMMPDWSAMEYVKRMLSLDQNYYPETLHRMIIINSPWYFSAIFAIIKPWLDEKTANKIMILGYNYLDTMHTIISGDQIPMEYGGTNTSFIWTESWCAASGCSQADIDRYLANREEADR